jgi:hypothetical protein
MSTKHRNQLIKLFPDYVVDDLYEILYNIVHKNVSIPASHKRVLFKHRRAVLQLLAAAKTKNVTRRANVYKQSGGFLPALIPIALGLLSTL